MNLYQCQERAKDEGFDKATFVADFPTGAKRCKWLDAYFGLFMVEGIDGFLMVKNVDEMLPDLVCSEFEVPPV